MSFGGKQAIREDFWRGIVAACSYAVYGSLGSLGHLWINQLINQSITAEWKLLRYFADEIYCVYLEKMGRGVLGTWACSSAVECLRALYNISHIYIWGAPTEKASDMACGDWAQATKLLAIIFVDWIWHTPTPSPLGQRIAHVKFNFTWPSPWDNQTWKNELMVMCQIRYPCGTLGMDRLDGRLSILSSRILYIHGRKLVENLVRHQDGLERRKLSITLGFCS